MKKLIFIISTVLFTLITNAASTKETLSDLELKELRAGKQIIKEVKQPKGPWPIVKVYQLIDATPLSSVAIFYAINYQTQYVPKLIKAEVVKTPSSLETWVGYELKMPWPIPNSVYIHAHGLSKIDQGYNVKWWMIESSSAEKVEGQASFTSFESKTLMSYENYVIPKSFLAPLVKGSMLKDVKTSLIAIKEEIEGLNQKKSPKINEFNALILNALDGKTVYQAKK